MSDVHAAQFRIAESKELQLEQYMSLSEDVSNKIDALISERSRLITYAVSWVIFSVLGTFIYRSQVEMSGSQMLWLNTLLGIIMLFCIFNAVKLFFRSNKIKKDVERESYILGDLLNITDSYKRKIYRQSDSAKRVYFDMRMSRIDFTHAKFKKQPQNTTSVKQETTQPKPTESPVPS